MYNIAGKPRFEPGRADQDRQPEPLKAPLPLPPSYIWSGPHLGLPHSSALEDRVSGHIVVCGLFGVRGLGPLRPTAHGANQVALTTTPGGGAEGPQLPRLVVPEEKNRRLGAKFGGSGG